MSAWQILAIEPTDDLKTLKKTYAVALKKAKPDEDPEGFQAVHSAYKQLSKQLKQQRKASKAASQPQPTDAPLHPQESTIGQSHATSLGQVLDDDAQAESERSLQPQSPIEIDIEKCDTQPDEDIKPAQAVMIDIEAEPVAEMPAEPEPVRLEVTPEDDIEIYQPTDHDAGAELPDVDALIAQAQAALELNDTQQTREVFEQIFEISGLLGFGEGQKLSQQVFAICLAQLAEHKGKAYCLQGQLAGLLCYHFNWLSERQSLETHFELAATDKMLSAFDKRIREAEQDDKYSAIEQRWQQRAQKKAEEAQAAAQRRASVFTRLLAFMIDITLVVVVCILLHALLDLLGVNFGIGYSLSAALGYFIGCEIQWAQTFGKRWLKMKVVDGNGNPPSALLVLWRTVALFISFGLIKLFFLHMYFWFKGRALHDPISRTDVWKETR
ncbi:RDD family protein [Motilimonas pumila]|uniref:J domain-containing protein n=1 Tax=Motilimonas pumila TaxID=2303987 RepID=A0A418YE48_9GAMM|nr:RDD family protein [Motilimonas pumila]RJG42799.1 hypothetical protein D1Z90_11965 [Motilimonas pumila]